MKAKKNKKVGNGFVKQAWQNVGLKSAFAYHEGRKNQRLGLPLSFDQTAVIKEYDRLVEEATRI